MAFPKKFKHLLEIELSDVGKDIVSIGRCFSIFRQVVSNADQKLAA